ncbi:unnamed protein product [Coffea canephora]|uniref:Uncharacterized protein n=1 Tax=Coffea canephora TaxID=49390 RepID=A0A068TYV7_COFCA|nr:unnamed protein product [Coffea canephora]
MHFTSVGSRHVCLSYFSRQSLLRGKFVRLVEEERPPSVAAGELVQLRALRQGHSFWFEDNGRYQFTIHTSK